MTNKNFKKAFTQLPKNSITQGFCMKKQNKYEFLKKWIFFPNYLRQRKKTMLFNGTGFTLIETLVAISVLLIAILGPMLVASRSIFYASDAKNHIISFNLAQEGIEYIRKVRDDQAFSGEWMTSSFNLNWCWGTGGCYVDTINNSITNCGASGCQLIKYDDATGYYNYSPTSNNTIFTRTITIDKNISADESEITSIVSWTSRTGAIKTITLTEHIFNWK